VAAEFGHAIVKFGLEHAKKVLDGDLLGMRITIPMAVEARKVASARVFAKRQPITSGYFHKDRSEARVAMHVPVRVEVGRTLPYLRREESNLRLDCV
jgi:hypothetical protein